MTGALLSIDIRGRDGPLARTRGPRGRARTSACGRRGFPNFFTISGPGSPSVLTNMIVSIEQHVNWITDCIAYMRDNGHAASRRRSTPRTPGSARERGRRLHALPVGNSWYLGANIPGKPRVFLPYVGGLAAYREKCEFVANNGYEGFTLTQA